MRKALARGTAGSPVASVVVAAGLVLAPAGAACSQESIDALPTGEPGLTQQGATPFVFAPDINAIPAPIDLARTVNTPSGLAPFTAPTSIASGLQLTFSQAIRYDDNSRRIADGAVGPVRGSKGDVYSVTNFGGSYAKDFGLQQVFVRGDYGLTRYRRNTDLDNTRFQFQAGLNWRIGSPCSGSLIVGANQIEVEFQDLLVGAATSLTQTERVDLQGRCHVYGDIYATFGAGLSHSSLTSQPGNDASRRTRRAGLEYAVPGLHTIGLETIHTATEFTNRTSTILNPVTTDLSQQEYRAFYNYIVSPKTNINLAGGILQSVSSSAFSRASQSVPVGSVQVNWRPTPKLTFSIGSQISATPAQTIQADYQRSQVATFAVIYTFSPKLSLSAAYVHARQRQSAFSQMTGVINDRETRTNTLSLDANYQASPFLFAGLGYRFSERTDKLTGLRVTSNLYTVSLNYRR